MSDTEYLDWLVGRRSANQKACFDLYKLLEIDVDVWKKSTENTRAAELLVGVGFSLWRAVFLGNRTGKRKAKIGHATSFLKTLVYDNMIGYQTDKTANEWTFNYYVHSARYRLEELHEDWGKDICPEYHRSTRDARDRWDYCHGIFETTIANFSKNIDKLRSGTKAAAFKRTAQKAKAA
jgi:hypothetical protein